MENINTLKEFLSIPRYVVITSHRNPDGDAIGSSLGLYHFLNKFGHTCRVIFPSEFPDNFSWMPHSDNIIIYDNEPEVAKDVVERADIVYCLDFNALDRIDKLGEMIAELRVPKVLIDHHLDPEPFADYELSDTTASSTSELVFTYIELSNQMKELDVDIASCLYTGIITDTGSFKYSTSPRLFRVVAALVELGVDDYEIQDKVYNSFTEKQLRLLGHCLSHRMEILPEYSAGIIVLTKADYERFDIKRGDTEGIVNYLLMMRKIKIAAFITEQPTIVKISLRSKGDFSVQEIASKYFNGGGHKNASGGYAFKSLGWMVRQFKKALPEYKEALSPYQ
jgi:phosphoesterase RecJ-like protein